MPITVIDHDVPNQTVAIVTGEVGLPELMQFATERVGERRTWALMFDTSRAVVNVSSANVRRLAQVAAHDLNTSPIGPVAIVASKAAMFGISRMFQTYSDLSGRTNVGVFRFKEDAQHWLDEVANQCRGT